MRAMLQRAHDVHRQWPIERVLAVYPHRLSMLAGWRIAGRLDVPLVLYMHDLCAEGLAVRGRLRQRFWRNVDRAALSEACLIVVPTDQFAQHYRRRGVNNVWVLPHCGPARQPASSPPCRDSVLRLLYSGNVYEPHADAMKAFIAAAEGCHDFKVTYLTHPGALDGAMGRLGARWLSYDQTAAILPTADVFVVVLGRDTPWPEEVMGCFPSKIIDYLSVGRPILAIVPPGCFVDHLVATTGCGAVVRQHDKASIRQAIMQLRDPGIRTAMTEAGRRLLRELDTRIWMPRLLERLRLQPVSEPLARVDDAGTMADKPPVAPLPPMAAVGRAGIDAVSAPARAGFFESLEAQSAHHEPPAVFLAGSDSQR